MGGGLGAGAPSAGVSGTGATCLVSLGDGKEAATDSVTGASSEGGALGAGGKGVGLACCTRGVGRGVGRSDGVGAVRGDATSTGGAAVTRMPTIDGCVGVVLLRVAVTSTATNNAA
jgi:hypothetical protein